MKKIYLFFAFLVVGFSVKAASAGDDYRNSYGEAFIFVEGGVEFAIYPDGQFDFFYNHRRTGYNVNVISPNLSVSYNSGYNYDPFVQYDDFGAVIQIENVPIYYDYYGRIIQAGHVQLSYNHFGMLARVGRLFLHYDRYNHFTHYSGYINRHNPYYVYRPWHRYYSRPLAHIAVVYHQPYRAHYHPNRMKYGHYRNYYKKHHNNDFRRHYYRPGDQVTSYHRGRRTTTQRDLRDHTRSSETQAVGNTRSNLNSVRDRNDYKTRQPQQVRSTSRRQADVRTRENVNTRSRSTSREYVADNRTSRVQSETSPEKNFRSETRQNSRRSSANHRAETRTDNTRARSNSRTGTIKQEATEVSPSRNSRSSRGRGN